MKSVMITGAAGFIGGALARRFTQNGWHVIGAGRTFRPSPHVAEWRSYDLAWCSLPGELLQGTDVLIHAAVARTDRKSDFQVNIDGTGLLFEAAAAAQTGQRIYLSSLAAHQAALSQYGQHKYALERLLDSRATIIRPGLVLGAGGIFAAMRRRLERSRTVPLPGGGRQPLQTVHIDDLTAAIFNASRDGVRRYLTVAEVLPVEFRDFFEALCRRIGVKPVFVGIPYWALEIAVRAGERMGIMLPIDRDNILGLKAMVAQRVTLDPDILPYARTYRESLESLIPAPLVEVPK
jgi:nucleoside-diphosphate-sugar epimerase